MKWKVNYHRSDGVIEITIRDAGGGKIDTLRANKSDQKSIEEIGRILKYKYDIDFTPTIKPDKGFFDY